MAVIGTRVAVSTGAVALADGTSATAQSPASFIVRNPTGSAAALDVGGAAVASGAGFALAAGESVNVDLWSGDVLYGISSQAITVHVLKTRS